MNTAPSPLPTVSHDLEQHVTETLRQIVQGLSENYQANFFVSLSNILCKTLGATYVIIGEIQKYTNNSIETLGVSKNGETIPNFTYKLKGTPCDNVRIVSGSVFVANNVSAKFPDDHFLKENGIESYFGIALIDSKNEVIGVLNALFDHPVLESEFLVSVAKLFSVRTATEIERRREEMKLREKDWILSESQKVAQVGSYDLDIVTGIWSSTYVLDQIFGLPDNYDKTIEGWAHCVYEADRAMMVEYFTCDVLGKKQKFDKEYRIKRLSDGDIRWVHGKGVLLFDGKLSVTRMVGTIQDITEYKAALSAIEQEKIKIETVIASISDGVVVVDENSCILRMNAVAQLMTGYTEAESRGKDFKDIFHFICDGCKDAPKKDLMKDVIVSRNPDTFEERVSLLRKDGVVNPVSVSASPVIRTDDVLSGAVCVIHNIAKEREFERQKDDFFSFAAHQLRSPLTSIRWSIESLLDEKAGFTTAVTDVLENMYETNKKALDVLNDFLETSRIDQGYAGQTVKDTVHIPTVIEEMLSYLLPVAQNKGVQLNTDISVKNHETILIDSRKFKYIVSNLLDNAIKYTNSGGKVDFNLAIHESEIAMSIADTGIGIPFDEQSKIFTKFFRAPNAFYQEHTGSGLGLFVVKSYVDQLRGTITFKSVPEQGTTFNLSLPIT